MDKLDNVMKRNEMSLHCTLYVGAGVGGVLTYKIGGQYFSLQILQSVVPPSPICCECQEILTYALRGNHSR